LAVLQEELRVETNLRGDAESHLLLAQVRQTERLRDNRSGCRRRHGRRERERSRRGEG
jgi:hypothetical protein